MTKKDSATKARYFRSFLLMQQFAADEIGARIAQARKEAGGMTQPQLADLLDLSVRQVQNIEGGATIPWKYFSLLGEIFKKSLGWFLYGEEAVPPDRLEALEAQVARLGPAVEEGFAAIERAIAHLGERQSPPDDQAASE